MRGAVETVGTPASDGVAAGKKESLQTIGSLRAWFGTPSGETPASGLRSWFGVPGTTPPAPLEQLDPPKESQVSPLFSAGGSQSSHCLILIIDHCHCSDVLITGYPGWLVLFRQVSGNTQLICAHRFCGLLYIRIPQLLNLNCLPCRTVRRAVEVRVHEQSAGTLPAWRRRRRRRPRCGLCGLLVRRKPAGSCRCRRALSRQRTLSRVSADNVLGKKSPKTSLIVYTVCLCL